VLLVNADDWGCDRVTTRAILDCVSCGAVSGVSAMVFMPDSAHAAALGREHGIDAGLHLNFTTPFSAPNCPSRLAERQTVLGRYLRRHRFARAIVSRGLARDFDYVVRAQIDEFCRLYGTEPVRFDGHHHMHLCANVLTQHLLPAGSVVRRNFSFEPDEKGYLNRLYRRRIDRRLARRHRVADFFFSLPPLEPPSRVARIVALARDHVVEVETHPVNPDEYRFLVEGQLSQRINGGYP
jgi:chitin disaccharide deacetylase